MQKYLIVLFVLLPSLSSAEGYWGRGDLPGQKFSSCIELGNTYCPLYSSYFNVAESVSENQFLCVHSDPYQPSSAFGCGYYQCPVETPYFYDGQCNVDPPAPPCEAGIKKGYSGAGLVIPENVCRSGCTYTRDGVGISINVTNSYSASYISTGSSCSGDTGGVNDGVGDPGSASGYTPPVTTGTNTSDTQSDTPNPGDTTTTEETTENKTGGLNEDVTISISDIVVIATKEQDVIKTTTQTSTLHPDGSVTLTTTTDYTSTNETTTTSTLDNNGNGSSDEVVTRTGRSGSTTTTTTTDSDGNSSSTTSQVGEGAGSAEESDNDDVGHAPEGTDDMYDHMLDDIGLDELNASMGNDAVPSHSFFNPLTGLGIGTAPCAQVPIGHPDHLTDFPGLNGCTALQILRAIMGWAIYLITFIALFKLAVTVRHGV